MNKLARKFIYLFLSVLKGNGGGGVLYINQFNACQVQIQESEFRQRP